MQRFLKVLIGVVVVLMVLILVAAMFIGNIVKSAVNTAGPKALGVPISIQNVSVKLLRGQFGLDGLVIGNPAGFKTPSAIKVNRVALNLKMASLFSKVLVIDRIYVGGPEITYEMGLKGSNIGAIQNKTASAKPAAAQPEPAAKPANESKKVQITDFLIENGKLNVSVIGMAGREVTMPLPTIHLTDIGKESGGATLQEVMAQVFSAIGSTVSDEAKGIAGSVEDVGKGAADTGKAAVKGAAGVGKAAGAGAVDAGKTVEAGAVDAGKAVGKDAGKALESVGGLLKGGKK